jgi:hypothetical protein
MAKCQRILDAAAENAVSHDELILEEALFKHHETKYRLTMDYLDFWITNGDVIRRMFYPSPPSVDNKQIRADRKNIRNNGFKIRNGCLYVDYQKTWVNRPPVNKGKVSRNLTMLKSMMDGYRSSLKNWKLAIS